MHYLRLIGYRSLLLLLSVQLIVIFGFLIPFETTMSLNNLGNLLLIFAMLCIASGGQIIYAINNSKSLVISQPKLAKALSAVGQKRAYNLFIGLNCIGIILGFYLSNSIGFPGFSGLFILGSLLLYLSGHYFSNILLVSNFIQAGLCAVCILSLGLFNLLPSITPENQATQALFFSILMDYALLAFMLVLLHQLVQDQININGDHKIQKRTLSILLGKDRTNKVLSILSILLAVGLVYYVYTYLFNHTYFVLYILFSMIAPLLFFSIKIATAKTGKQFSVQLFILKIVLWTTAISIAWYNYILH